jgi:hypothetical protein
MERDSLLACLADLGECGVKFNGCFTEPDGTEYYLNDVEEAIAELRADVAKLEKLIAWAKTMPEVDE